MENKFIAEYQAWEKPAYPINSFVGSTNRWLGFPIGTDAGDA